MKHFLRITETRPGPKGKTIYKTENGKEYIGKDYNWSGTKTVIVEASNTPDENGYYTIIKFVSST